jgi:hypothetical protein
MNGLLRILGTGVALMFVAGLPILGGPLAQRLHPPPAPQPGCEVGQWPEFRHGFAELRQALDSSIMGDAIECEHALGSTSAIMRRVAEHGEALELTFGGVGRGPVPQKSGRATVPDEAL